MLVLGTVGFLVGTFFAVLAAMALLIGLINCLNWIENKLRGKK